MRERETDRETDRQRHRQRGRSWREVERCIWEGRLTALERWRGEERERQGRLGQGNTIK